MSGVSATCWKCGVIHDEILLPLSRTEECRECGADFHVCRMCRFYDKSAGNECREPVADFVSNKTRANFCGYLELRRDPGTYSGQGEQSGVNDDLQSLFGLDEGESAAGNAPQSLDDLFGLDK